MTYALVGLARSLKSVMDKINSQISLYNKGFYSTKLYFCQKSYYSLILKANYTILC